MRTAVWAIGIVLVGWLPGIAQAQSQADEESSNLSGPGIESLLKGNLNWKASAPLVEIAPTNLPPSPEK